MQVVLVILSLGLLGLIIYFVISPKSSKLLKLTALIALGLIAISIGVCAVFLIMGPGEDEEHIPVSVFQGAQPQAVNSGNIPAVIVFFVVFLLIMGLIIFLALREQRKKSEGLKSAQKAPVFPASGELNIGSSDLFDEDSFDIETD
jgi:preprotein translocase subunit YajC